MGEQDAARVDGAGVWTKFWNVTFPIITPTIFFNLILAIIGALLVFADRQQVWEAWKDANQVVWQRLTGAWEENEIGLRELLDTARQQLTIGNTSGAQRTLTRFYESSRVRETRRERLPELRAEADAIRTEADEVASRPPPEPPPAPPPGR